ncbi:MAG: thioredoxin family protein [Alphaproteobacteria bacterium]|nr:thioredoxin family protein [Alphaproteobacteria bacterium]
MVEQLFCEWCEAWDEEIGVVYDKTDEGKRAPLVKIDIKDPVPPGMRFVSEPRFTPTFILVRDGTEVGRIEGYPGEDFFYGLLQQLLNRTGTTENQDKQEELTQ